MGTMIVEKAGLLDVIQDQGRIHFQKYGVPQAGAMDNWAYQLGNILVGNERHLPSLEITWFGPTLRFTKATVAALTGAHLQAQLNGMPITPWRRFKIEAGDLLSFGPAVSGCRAYLALAGGFTIQKIMGSSSTYVKGEMGGWDGRALQTGDQIPYPDLPPATKKIDHLSATLHPDLQPTYKEHTTLRVLLGPQEEYFTEEGLASFCNDTYMVSQQSNRMGLRLQGPAIKHRFGADILSDSVPFGGIQVPANGQPIILMADRQTTGGYPKIGTIISVDLPLVAQLRPQQTINFQPISIATAQDLLREQQQQLKCLELAIK